jgi:hypothetical protein
MTIQEWPAQNFAMVGEYFSNIKRLQLTLTVCNVKLCMYLWDIPTHGIQNQNFKYNFGLNLLLFNHKAKPLFLFFLSIYLSHLVVKTVVN